MSDRLRERRSSVPEQRNRAAETAYNPHLGDRVAGNEYKPKYTHQDIDAFVDDIGKSGSRPYATVVVAAVDSTATDAANADFVCAGQDDHLTVQQAIDSIDPSVGGLVLLLEGGYIFTGTVAASSMANLSIEGVGAGTVITGPTLAQGGESFIFDTCFRPSISNLAIGGTVYNPILMYRCEALRVVNCWLGDTVGGIGSFALMLEECGQFVVSDNNFYGMTQEFDFAIYSALSNDGVISNNTFEEASGVMVEGPYSLSETGLVIVGNQMNSGHDGILLLDDATDVSIVSNTFVAMTDGVEVTSGSTALGVLVSNNTFRSCTNAINDAGGVADTGAGNFIDRVWVP